MHDDHRGGRALWRLGLVALIGVLGLMIATIAKGASLERELQRVAPEILAQLRARNYQTVGVLKFRAGIGDAPVTDRLGPINLLIAERLETALVLAMSERPEEQVRLVSRASNVAAGLASANHLTASGRASLFQASYPLAWGRGSAQIDAFLTGVVQVEPDLQGLWVAILVAGRNKSGFERIVPRFRAAVDGAILNEIGQSFHLRGAAAANVDSTAVPAVPPSRPMVILRVIYDNLAIPIETRDDGLYIPAPRAGQVVVFRLERADAGPETLGCVLKVNGESTLYRQRGPDRDCKKWILEPACPPITIPGFQLANGQQVEEFRVVPPSPGQNLVMDYGPDVGTISLTVFPSRPQPPAIPPGQETDPDLVAVTGDASTATALDAEERRLAAIANAPLLAQTPPTLRALQNLLAGPGARGGQAQGIIAAGNVRVNPIRPVTFVAGDEPIISAVIRYYDLQPAPAPAN